MKGCFVLIPLQEPKSANFTTSSLSNIFSLELIRNWLLCLRFDVSVEHSLIVHALYSHDKLVHPGFDFGFWKVALAALDRLV